jgi:hypothetical protein
MILRDQTSLLIAEAAAALIEGRQLAEELREQLARMDALQQQAASRARTFNAVAASFIAKLGDAAYDTPPSS